MLTFEGQSLLNPAVFNSLKNLDTIEECSADSCASCPGEEGIEGQWRRDHVVATSHAKIKDAWDLTFTSQPLCDQYRCGKMQERWNRHVDKHHAATKILNSSHAEDHLNSYLSTFGVTPHPAQAETNSINSPKDLGKNTNNTTAPKENREEIPLRHTETQNIINPKINFYKQHLQDVVLKWFLIKIPMIPTMDNKIKLKRLKAINKLVETISDEALEAGNLNYKDKVRRQIETCLDELPMWYPGSKKDKLVFRNNLCILLLKGIEKLNEKWLFINNEYKSSVISTYDVFTYPFHDGNKNEIIRLDINKWVDENIKISNPNVDIEFITDLLVKRVIPTLNSKSNRKYMLRAQIKNILDELSEYIELPKNRTMHLNKLSIDLMLRLLRLKYKIEYGNKHIDKRVAIGHCNDGELTDDDNESEETANIRTFSDDSEEEIFKDVTDTRYDRIDSAIIRCHGIRQDTVNDVCTVLKPDEFTDEASNLTENLEDLIKCDDITLGKDSQSLSGTMVILTSKHGFTDPYNKDIPLTSTPLYPKEKKEQEKLTCCEKDYMNKVADVVKGWLDTTDMTFNCINDHIFKQTIANEVAAEVKDLAILSQIQESMKMSYFEGVLAFIIMKAILKYGLLNTPPTAETQQVVDLKERIKNLGMTDMMMPQHGNRQQIANIKFRCENPTDADFKADPLDILEDNISVWLNEQPASTINVELDDNRERRNKLLSDAARKVQEKIKNKVCEDEIKEALRDWLKEIVNPRSNKDIDELADDLKNKAMNLPQNETIKKAVQKRARAGEDTDFDSEQHGVDTDTDEALNDFINKFAEQSYNSTDSLARGAFANMLLQELLKLSPVLRKEACDSNLYVKFNADEFRRELEYIKEVTDWLKNIPFYHDLASGNDRVDFVNGLAKNIADIEEERIKYPGKMNYELILHTDIIEYMKKLPIPPQQRPTMVTYINQLRERIARHRPQISDPVPRQLSTHLLKNENDFAKFIEKILDLHKIEIGEDQLKLEAYTSRLLKEIKRMVLEKDDTDKLSNAEVYNRLADVHIPGKESIQLFNIEMKYAREIADWLHNFPLMPLRTRNDVEARMRMISDLAEKMIDTDIKMLKSPNDPNTNRKFDNYIADWIDNLDLNPNKEIVVPILIAQLKNRMANVKRVFQTKQQPQVEIVQITSARSNNSIQQNRSNSVDRNDGPVEPSKVENPGDLMVHTIESFCKNLPINDEDEDSANVTKAKVATSLFQKVGVLNADPRITHDDLLYRDMLADEIENELQNLSNHTEVISEKENLKTSFLDMVMDAKKSIKDMSAGENYKQALENAINASMPNPVHVSNKIEPGYELYKNRMAMLWILENYDYATDFNSLKYKRKLNEDIEKYSNEAQKRNVFPMEKHEIFNQIFSALYKQNAPNESSMVDEVKYIKMRCEVEAWVKELPLKKASGFQELFERDQIFNLLTKRLYDIEKTRYPNSDEKMTKEIRKWLKKLPILPGEEDNVPKYAAKLICNLKATQDIRICKRAPESNKKISKLELKENSDQNYSKNDLKLGKKENTSQIAGPSGVKPKSCCEGSTVPRKKAGDLITSAIETWCKQLPLKSQNPNDAESNEHLKDKATIKLYQILSDLHADPNVISNEGLYEHHLNVEIEKLLSDLPRCCELQQTKNARRQHLVQELLSVRPLIKDDLEREGYKQKLKHAISSFLDETTNKKIAVNDSEKDNVIDNFIEYSFHADDFDDKYIYKIKLNEVLADLLLKNKGKTQLDPLLTSNHLISEMSKIKPPKKSILMEEVQEIKMKNVVGELFNEIQIPENEEEKLKHRDQMKLALAKKLVDIENTGRNCPNRQKMKTEINKAFKKLGAEISPEKVDAFVSNLNTSEGERNLPVNSADGCSCAKKHSSCIQSKNDYIHSGPCLVMKSPQQSYHQACTEIPQSSETPPYPISSLPPSGFMPRSPKTSKPDSPLLSSPNSSQMSTPSQSPSSMSKNASALNQPQNPDFGSSSPQIALREHDQDRPVIINGLSNNLRPPELEETATRTIRAQETRDCNNEQKNQKRNAATDVDARNFGVCKCTRTKRLPNCKGKCKQKNDACDCGKIPDCNCYETCYPCIPGFIHL